MIRSELILNNNGAKMNHRLTIFHYFLSNFVQKMTKNVILCAKIGLLVSQGHLQINSLRAIPWPLQYGQILGNPE